MLKKRTDRSQLFGCTSRVHLAGHEVPFAADLDGALADRTLRIVEGPAQIADDGRAQLMDAGIRHRARYCAQAAQRSDARRLSMSARVPGNEETDR